MHYILTDRENPRNPFAQVEESASNESFSPREDQRNGMPLLPMSRSRIFLGGTKRAEVSRQLFAVTLLPPLN